MKNNLKNRLIMFTVSYAVSFVIARVYRNYQYNEYMKGQMLLIEFHANNASKQNN